MTHNMYLKISVYIYKFQGLLIGLKLIPAKTRILIPTYLSQRFLFKFRMDAKHIASHIFMWETISIAPIQSLPGIFRWCDQEFYYYILMCFFSLSNTIITNEKTHKKHNNSHHGEYPPPPAAWIIVVFWQWLIENPIKKNDF